MSLNQSYGYDKKLVEKKYGKTFSTIDFEFAENLSEEVFSRLKKKTNLGTLSIGNSKVRVNLYDLERIYETAKTAHETAIKKYRLGRMR